MGWLIISAEILDAYLTNNLNKWPCLVLNDRIMKQLGFSELRVLRRLAIDPSARQVGIAKQLDVSRSAVSQIWHRLTRERRLRVRSLLDYGMSGFTLLFGWARSEEDVDGLERFSRWLDVSPFVITNAEALMSTMADERVYFEVLLPLGQHRSRFLEQLARFEKRPYNLTIEYEPASTITEHMNLGIFDGSSWAFEEGFKFEASIDAARGFTEIFPADIPLQQSFPSEASAEIVAAAACIEKDYYSSAAQVHNYMHRLGLPSPSPRTLRRKLSDYRESQTLPYIEIQNIGLGLNIIACINDQTQERNVARFLHSQGHLLPRARIVSGRRLVMVDVSLPSTSNWSKFSNSLSNMLKSDAQICTFITETRVIRKGLEYVLSYLVQAEQ